MHLDGLEMDDRSQVEDRCSTDLENTSNRHCCEDEDEEVGSATATSGDRTLDDVPMFSASSSRAGRPALFSAEHIFNSTTDEAEADACPASHEEELEEEEELEAAAATRTPSDAAVMGRMEAELAALRASDDTLYASFVLQQLMRAHHTLSTARESLSCSQLSRAESAAAGADWSQTVTVNS